MFHRIIFVLLSSVFRSFNRCGCFQTYMNIACRSTQSELKMPRVSNAFKDYTGGGGGGVSKEICGTVRLPV